MTLCSLPNRKSQIPNPKSPLLPLTLLALALLATFAVVTLKPPLGVVGQHVYPYHPKPQRGAFLLLILFGLPLAAGPLWLVRRPTLSARQAWCLAAAFTLWGLMLHLVAATAPKMLPGAELAFPCLWTNTEGAYAARVPAARSPARFLAAYADALDVSPDPASPRFARIHHPHVHPPGIILAFAALEGLFDASPSLAAAADEAVARLLPSSRVLRNVALVPLHHPVAVSATAALLLLAAASLVPLLAFLAVRRVAPLEAAVAAAGLAALIPGTYLFSPSIDQAYPTLTLLLCWLAIGLAATRRTRWGVGLGVAFYAALFLHVGYGLVAAILGLAGLLAWRSHCPERTAREMAAAYARPLLGAALGFLAPALLLWLAFDYPTFRVLWLCVRNNAWFNALVGRTWWPWAAVAPFEFALSLGFGLAFLVAGTWLLEAADAVRARTLRGRGALLLAAGAALLALHLLGLNRGETARLWLFLTPLLVLGGVDALWRRAARPQSLLAAVAVAQFAQTVLFAVFLDLGRTSTFLHDLPAIR